jgi:hypothetical protein
MDPDELSQITYAISYKLEEKNVGVDLVSTQKLPTNVSSKNLLEMTPDERSKA